MLSKYISAILALSMLVPVTTATTEMFVQHEEQRKALRCEERDIPYVVEYGKPSEGIGREFVPQFDAAEEELEELVILCYLEAGGESDECVRAVAEVVFNRLTYGAWGESLTEVIYAPGEFEPAHLISEFDAQGNAVIEERLDEIRDIVYDVYYNGCEIDAGVMFFRADYFHSFPGAVDEFAVGNVYFSSSRWCDANSDT